ncbi:hypothetical protein [Nocardia coubleae]|uniref:Uncharacterized protein n=1 Tax=Nocardia coubleae TaxID=356147 RepID=A0A846WCV7_9NOCA|nr:hypothetical protein [Nocardia coubleae]NKX91349.1 hypothetical protein [Nocardia coubleae]
MHPPPDRQLPEDRAIYGSKTSAADKAEAAANSVDAAAVQSWFDVQGYTFAEDLLSIYLGNNDAGFENEISSAQFNQIMQSGNAQQKVAECLDEIKEQARQDPQIGVTRDLTSQWLGAEETEGDLFYALGHYDIAVGSSTTVIEGKDGLLAEIMYKVYVYDFYNYDKKQLEALSLNIGNTLNNEMRQLEEAGWARSFRSRGASTGTMRWFDKL